MFFEFFSFRVLLLGVAAMTVYILSVLGVVAMFPERFKSGRKIHDYVFEFQFGKALKALIAGWGAKAIAIVVIGGLMGSSLISVAAILGLSLLASSTFGGVDPGAMTLGLAEFFADSGMGEALADSFPEFFAGAALVSGGIIAAWEWLHGWPVWNLFKRKT